MAADEGQQAIGGFSRRSVLRGGLLAGAGVAAAGAMSAVLTGAAKAATPDPQPGWGYCEYCAAMWWTAGESGSACPGTNAHGLHHVRSGSYNYTQYNGATSGSNPQVNWRWCGFCQGMFWGGFTGLCYGNVQPGYHGPHKAGATNYNLSFNEAPGLGSTTDPQAYWRWCGLCSLLYWQGPSGSTAGACAANIGNNGPFGFPFGPHEAGSGTVYDMYLVGTY
jgi:hypothetical protein